MFTTVDPLTCSASALLAELSCMEPGLSVMSLLQSVDAEGLSPDDAVTYLQIHERCRSWWEAHQVPAMVAAAAVEPRVDEYRVMIPQPGEERLFEIRDAIREELSCALRVSASVMQDEIDMARLLSGPLTATWRAWELGQITRRHVAVMAEAVRRLPGFAMRDETERAEFAIACRQFQQRVLPRAIKGTVADTRRAGKAAVLAIDGEGQARRREWAKGSRNVWVSPDVDGLSLLVATMATEDALAVMTQINATAHARHDAACRNVARRKDERQNDAAAVPAMSLGEHRAQALAALVLGGNRVPVGSGVAGSGAEPVKAHVNLTIDLATLLSLRDAPGDGIAAGQVDLAGDGPVTASVIRDLLADPECAISIRRLVTDPLTGHLLDYGRRSYDIPQALRDYITARDKACRFPGCNRRADRCQIDHAQAWNAGGHTSRANLGALCTRHHQLKTHAGWQITDSRPDGSCTWTSPQGRRYDHHPPPIGTPA
jgi:hypothetical protein